MPSCENASKSLSLGIRGEDFVAASLTRRGLSIVSRNFRRRGFEIDLIARKGKNIYFVEVKTRKSATVHDSLLPKSKIRSLQRGADYFLYRVLESKDWAFARIDLAVVTLQPNTAISYFSGITS